jgi:hypothetical protein
VSEREANESKLSEFNSPLDESAVADGSQDEGSIILFATFLIQVWLTITKNKYDEIAFVDSGWISRTAFCVVIRTGRHIS